MEMVCVAYINEEVICPSTPTCKSEFANVEIYVKRVVAVIRQRGGGVWCSSPGNRFCKKLNAMRG